MKTKYSRISLMIMGLSLLSAIFFLLVPTVYIVQQNKAVMGYTTVFGGHCWNFSSTNSTVYFHPSAGGIVTFCLSLASLIVIALFGKGNKSPYFFSFCFNVAVFVLCFFQATFFVGVNHDIYRLNVTYSINFVGAYLVMVTSFLGGVISLVGLCRKPDKRY
jgi:hypothetical protein